MYLQQLHVAIQGVNQPHGPNQLMDSPDASTAQPAGAVGNLIMDIPGGEHRIWTWIEKLASQTFLDSALEIAPSLA
jgi:hypothetical protein